MIDRELKQRIYDARPVPPQDFAERIDRELVRLQKGKDGGKMRRKMPVVALVAILLAALTAFGAIAATVAGNLLKDRLRAGGAGDVAEQVQEVHEEQSDGEFGFAIEQCYWEGNELCLSYRATVPRDGNEYLLGLEMPMLNGERLKGGGLYMDDELSGHLILLGGEDMTTWSDILRMTAYANQVKDADNRVSVRATFMTPKRPVKWVSDRKYQSLLGEGAYTDKLPEDGIFYVNSEEFTPVLGLAEIGAVQDYWRECEANGAEAVRMTADRLESMGLVEVKKTFESAFNVDDARYDGPVYRGIENRSLRFDGFTAEVHRFELSHLNCAMTIRVMPDEGVSVGDLPQDFALLKPDGSPLVPEGQEWVNISWINIAEDGPSFCSVRCETTGILAIGDANSLLLAPEYYDGQARSYQPDIDRAVTIVPTEQRPSDAAGAVWATGRGNYYHSDRFCMGMEGAVETTVTEAEAEGKQACPVCMG